MKFIFKLFVLGLCILSSKISSIPQYIWIGEKDGKKIVFLNSTISSVIHEVDATNETIVKMYEADSKEYGPLLKKFVTQLSDREDSSLILELPHEEETQIFKDYFENSEFLCQDSLNQLKYIALQSSKVNLNFIGIPMILPGFETMLAHILVGPCPKLESQILDDLTFPNFIELLESINNKIEKEFADLEMNKDQYNFLNKNFNIIQKIEKFKNNAFFKWCTFKYHLSLNIFLRLLDIKQNTKLSADNTYEIKVKNDLSYKKIKKLFKKEKDLFSELFKLLEDTNINVTQIIWDIFDIIDDIRFLSFIKETVQSSQNKKLTIGAISANHSYNNDIITFFKMTGFKTILEKGTISDGIEPIPLDQLEKILFNAVLEIEPYIESQPEVEDTALKREEVVTETDLDQSPKSSQTCANCFSEDANKKCGKCGKISYCSKECQVFHWKVHKINCKKEQVTTSTPDIINEPILEMPRSIDESSSRLITKLIADFDKFKAER